MMRDNDEKLMAAAAFLRQARRGARARDLPVDLVPLNAAESYRIQDLVMADTGIAGWKIGATADAFSCGALGKPALDDAPGTLTLGDHRPEIEVEIAIHLTRDLPPRDRPYDRADILAAIGNAHAAFEVVESRFIDRKQANPLSTLADSQSSRGFVIGEAIADWRGLDLANLAITLSLDGVELAQKRGGATTDQTITALVWLANHATARGTGLQAGQYVITGARIGPLVIPQGRDLTAHIEAVGSVGLKLV